MTTATNILATGILLALWLVMVVGLIAAALVFSLWVVLPLSLLTLWCGITVADVTAKIWLTR